MVDAVMNFPTISGPFFDKSFFITGTYYTINKLQKLQILK